MREQFLSAKSVAQLLNIQTATLAKWRRQEKGPQGWRYASPTLVLYPKGKVLEFIASMATKAEPSTASLKNLNTRRSK